MPATVGGKTIGASTKGRMKLVNLFELLASTQASGTPSSNEKIADNVEVHIESLIAVKSESCIKNVLHGTFIISESKGAAITKVAMAASALVANPNFICFQNLGS